MASSINASTSGPGGVITTADNSGILNIQTANTSAITIDTSQNVGIGLTSPTSKLTVRTTDGDGVSIQNAAGTAYRWAVNADNSFSCVNTGVAERMRIDSSGNTKTYGTFGINTNTSFGNTTLPTTMFAAKNGTPNVTFTVVYYQTGAAWEPMQYRIEATSTQASLTANQTAWWIINMTHYNGSTVASVAASGGTGLAGFTLSYGNSGSGSGTNITSTVTITPTGGQNYTTASIQVTNYGGVASIS